MGKYVIVRFSGGAGRGFEAKKRAENPSPLNRVYSYEKRHSDTYNNNYTSPLRII